MWWYGMKNKCVIPHDHNFDFFTVIYISKPCHLETKWPLSPFKKSRLSGLYKSVLGRSSEFNVQLDNHLNSNRNACQPFSHMLQNKKKTSSIQYSKPTLFTFKEGSKDRASLQTFLTSNQSPTISGVLFSR